MNLVSRAVQQHALARYFALFAILALAALILTSCGGSNSDSGGDTHNCPAGQTWNGSACVPDIANDTTPPTVSITSPANNSSVSGTVTLTATASDTGSGVGGVQFERNGTPMSSDIATNPYEYKWDSTKVANGNYSITAFAHDKSGNTARSPAISLTVNNAVTPVMVPPSGLSYSFTTNATTSWMRDVKLTWVNKSIGDTFTVAQWLHYGSLSVQGEKTLNYPTEQKITTVNFTGLEADWPVIFKIRTCYGYGLQAKCSDWAQFGPITPPR